MSDLPVLTATRYVQPLREGGSLPAVVDTDSGELFVAKFRGAGQGAKALIAEIIVAALARHLGLPTPEIAIIRIPETFGQSEGDPEIQDLLRASHGVNFGVRYLDGAFNYDGTAAHEFIPKGLAAQIVWFDAYTTNPDRTHRNPNILIWNRKPWLIDHGAALYAHHDWRSVDMARTRAKFPLIKDHVLLAIAGDIEDTDSTLADRLDGTAITRAVDAVPDELLSDKTVASDFRSPAAARARYVDYLLSRLTLPREFVSEAVEAQERVRHMKPRRVPARR